jgi:hypothetical protein
MHDHLIAEIQGIFLILFTGIGFIAFFTPTLSAQSENVSSQSGDRFAIRVEAREVIVPVFVANKNYVPKKFPVDPRKAKKKNIEQEITGLTSKDIHVFEDGIEQPIKDLRVEPVRFWSVPDSIISHKEYSDTPKGIWAGPDIFSGTYGRWVSSNLELLQFNDVQAQVSDVYHLSWYLIFYDPPSSVEGSCHQIKVTVDREDASVYSRNEYCNTKHSPSDPLKGTKAGERMEEAAASAQKTKIPITVQAAATFNSTSAGLVNIAVEFPWSALSTYWDGIYRTTDVTLLGLVYNKEGTLVSRFSDIAFSPKALDFYTHTGLPLINDKIMREYGAVESTSSRLPVRYETQIDLPAGSYNLRIVLTDCKNFGRADVPFTVEAYDPNNIAVSEIVLGKRFTKMAVVWPKYGQSKSIANPMKPPDGEVSTAPEYVPLVSKGIGITPTGDTRIHKGDSLLSYFEVYEPALASGLAKVQYEMRVIESKTGQTIVDTGLRSADSYINPGKLIIPIAEGIAFKKLHTGAYRVEVQASDSTGKQTPWRSASFTVE